MVKAKRIGLLFGIVLTILGIVLLTRLSAGYFWSILLILFGLLFESGVLGRGAGRFVPGGILLVTGVVLLVCNIFGYDKMSYLWPAFVFAPGFGLFQAYLVKKSKGLLRSSMVLIVLSAIFFIAAIFRIAWGRVLFGAVLIALGAVILIKSLRGRAE
ncbi:MAG: Uncharacterized protein XD58_0027 [Thermotoga sp. 50_1627]|uniref:hypothetical protein n=1 Tax=Pseudothermotoga sp. TaxID=2033661 RepID=UPI00076C53AD|nr:MAG: Uncharacterized protein XD45_0016 [Thermotoga sp. 50_64]KUK25866.1 MAG: Uncharacterized protein XD58_0027 [Thermotoga sp. 50_1627]MBC7116152.1 hypothetical protein [Pseudothermotoga sp.]MDK2923565.1 hypothetical protein [Pseudothermotoga sp.]HCO98039.1 hypothetical protein [Pseudothermotoga sp.]